jgi:hypothetical protein
MAHFRTRFSVGTSTLQISKAPICVNKIEDVGFVAMEQQLTSESVRPEVFRKKWLKHTQCWVKLMKNFWTQRIHFYWLRKNWQLGFQYLQM